MKSRPVTELHASTSSRLQWWGAACLALGAATGAMGAHALEDALDVGAFGIVVYRELVPTRYGGGSNGCRVQTSHSGRAQGPWSGCGGDSGVLRKHLWAGGAGHSGSRRLGARFVGTLDAVGRGGHDCRMGGLCVVPLSLLNLEHKKTGSRSSPF